MKVILLFILSSVCATSFAEIFECRTKTKDTYKLALEKTTGTVSQMNRAGAFSALPGEVTVSRGDREIYVSLTTPQKPINWNDPANRRACYVQGLADLNFRLSRQRNFVSFYKPMFRNPNRKGCPSYPPIGRVPPTMLTCRAGR